MYTENEELILLQNVGIEGKDGFIPKDSEVFFVKAVDDPRNLSRSMVVIKFNDRIISLPELAVKPKKDKALSALKDFNNSLMESDNSLKIYHHNPIMRGYYIAKAKFMSIFLDPIKEIYRRLTNSEKTSKVDTDKKLVNEIKALMKSEE